MTPEPPTEQRHAAIDRGARALAYQAHMRDRLAPPTWWDEASECLSEALDVEEMASAIWEASRADEGTISATGAKIVAKALRARLLGPDARNRDRGALGRRTIAPHLETAALRTVLDLHRPDPANGTDWCRRCGEAWPCATASAVNDAVGGQG